MRKSIIFIFLCLSFFVNYNDAVSGGGSVSTMSTSVGYMAAVLCPVIMCSSALITSKVAVTTSSCINTLTPDQVTLYVGSVKYYDGGLEKPLGAIKQHPSYDKATFDYNIALLGLLVPLTSTEMSTYKIAPIPIASALPPTNQYALVSAYGATDPNLTLPDNLQRTYLLVYPVASCQTYKKNRITATMFCAGDPNGAKDLCPGDQGAPFVYTNTLVGIYNWGCSCGLSDPNPSSPVFTNVVYLKNWISTNSATM